ncbi:MAG: PEP-CTERM sorting domain-containing protein [Pseudomonadota bacterium]|nr:PEP-CTERM sorting domain-containing protein [Pseudomonadota bacterium]
MFKKSPLAAAILFMVSFGAYALPINYKFEGNGIFSVGGATYGTTNLGADFTVTMSGDTVDVGTSLFGAGVPAISGLTATFGWGAGSATLSSSVYVFNSQSLETVGFGNAANADLLDIFHSGLGSYDLISNISFQEVGGNAYWSQWTNVASSEGLITMGNIDPVRFSAQVSSSQVPEPSTLAILGLGLAGLVIARRKAI